MKGASIKDEFDHLLLAMLRRKNISEMNVNWGKTH
jgi:hypothetical protein